MKNIKMFWIVFLSVLGTAIITFAATFLLARKIYKPRKVVVNSDGEISYQDKLQEVEGVINAYYIGEIDNKMMGDALAEGMIKGLGDEWSYYITNEDYDAYVENLNNAYVGIGVTVTTEGVDTGVLITDVTPNGPAYKAGIQKGDIITAVDGTPVRDGSKDSIEMSEMRNRIRGEEGSKVSITILRGTVSKTYELIRESIKIINVTTKWLDGNIFYIRINNFQENTAEDTIAAIREGMEENCAGIIFDVRYNPGGYKRELVDLLDYILPKGPLFRSVDYSGKESVDYSDDSHIDVPMVVLVNYDSYSAAEFFAAALQEYEYAVIVGEQTYGKGYFQQSFQLSDGSAVNLSIGKYTTPNGKSLVGKGVTPDRKVELTDKQKSDLYYNRLPLEDDPQLQEAILVLDPSYVPELSSEQTSSDSGSASGLACLSKIKEIGELIDYYFIGEIDEKQIADSAAEGMINGLGDEWSYYIPEESYASFLETSANAYVGIGVTITIEGVDEGLLITDVTPDSPAFQAGIEIGDVMVAVEGTPIRNGEEGCLDLTETKNRVRGTEGTDVTITILRDGARKDYTITRARIKVVNVTWEMLDQGIGYIRIRNFDENAADDTIAAIDDLIARGAKSLLFDVRFNPGGYKRELVQLLDYILPEGPLFRSVDYAGKEHVDYSGESHIDLPIAVLVNYDSYSAAEFFAAALQEYDYADIVGEQTYGKGRFQSCFQLSDGSAVNLSIGEYTTPNGVSLVGKGITPDYLVELTEGQRMDLYYNRLPREDDTQFQKAISVLTP